MAGQIFFSYARRDADFVLKVASALRADGVELWVDQLDISSGEHWDESVQGALKSCSRLVVVLSPDSVNSANVLDEVCYALGQQKRVVPVLLRPCEIPFRLNRIQHIDFTAGYEKGYRALLAALSTPSARRPPKGASPPPADPPAAPAAPPRPAPQPPSRGGFYRHMALGAALMFCALLIIGLISGSRTVEQDPASAQQVTSAGTAATAPAPKTESGATDAGVNVAASTASAPISPVGDPDPDAAAKGAAGAPAAPVVADPAPTAASAASVVADPAPTAAPAAPPPLPAPNGIGSDDITNFVARFIGAHNRHDVGQILALYDEGVDYLEAGQGTRFVSIDKHAMYNGWTAIQFRLGSKIDYALADDHQGAILDFVVDFDAEDSSGPRHGRVREVMQLRQVDGALKITAERHPLEP